MVLSRDLGSLRVPPFVAFIMSSILFVLGLLMLHWREKDENEVEAKKPEPQAAEKRPDSRSGKGVSMLRRLRSVILLALCAISALVLFAAPAGAQQLVDAAGRATAPVGSRSCS